MTLYPKALSRTFPQDSRITGHKDSEHAQDATISPTTPYQACLLMLTTPSVARGRSQINLCLLQTKNRSRHSDPGIS